MIITCTCNIIQCKEKLILLYAFYKQFTFVVSIHMSFSTPPTGFIVYHCNSATLKNVKRFLKWFLQPNLENKWMNK